MRAGRYNLCWLPIKAAVGMLRDDVVAQIAKRGTKDSNGRFPECQSSLNRYVVANTASWETAKDAVGLARRANLA